MLKVSGNLEQVTDIIYFNFTSTDLWFSLLLTIIQNFFGCNCIKCYTEIIFRKYFFFYSHLNKYNLKIIGVMFSGCDLVENRRTVAVTGYSGESVVLRCSCTELLARPQQIQWMYLIENRYREIYPNEQMENYKNRVKLLNPNTPGNLSLHISALTTEDQGIYQCFVSSQQLVAFRLTVLHAEGSFLLFLFSDHHYYLFSLINNLNIQKYYVNLTYRLIDFLLYYHFWTEKLHVHTTTLTTHQPLNQTQDSTTSQKHVSQCKTQTLLFII